METHKSTSSKELCEAVNKLLGALVKASVISEHPDSRAFGAYVEKEIKDQWSRLCKDWDVEPQAHPGRRTIFDVSFLAKNRLVGIDIKSKDLDTTRYSDGGICAVSNLLKFLVRERALFLLAEFGYKITSGKVEFSYVATAPFHCLPADIYRIENLGTGQVRLNYTIQDAWDKIDWNRSEKDFYKIFSELCLRHYERVEEDAKKRFKAIEAFINSDYTEIHI